MAFHARNWKRLIQLLVCISLKLKPRTRPYLLTTLAWDNIDRLEETLRGKGTSHRVNDIAVQASVVGPQLPREKNQVAKRNQRTVAANELPLPADNDGERSGPPPRPYATIDATDVIAEAFKKNLLWFIVRLHSQHNQTISSWT